MASGLDRITYEAQYNKHINYEKLYCSPHNIKRFINSFENIKALGVREGNIDIIDVCMDIDIAMKNVTMTDKQLERVLLWKNGYNEFEISKMLRISRPLIHRDILKICKRISEYLTNKENE